MTTNTTTAIVWHKKATSLSAARPKNRKLNALVMVWRRLATRQITRLSRSSPCGLHLKSHTPQECGTKCSYMLFDNKAVILRTLLHGLGGRRTSTAGPKNFLEQQIINTELLVLPARSFCIRRYRLLRTGRCHFWRPTALCRWPLSAAHRVIPISLLPKKNVIQSYVVKVQMKQNIHHWSSWPNIFVIRTIV